jgi:hypothetical protein
MIKKILLCISILLLSSLVLAAGVETVSAEKYNYNLNELNKLTPYMVLNKDYTVAFDSAKAKMDKLPNNYIKLGERYEKYHNNFVKIARTEGINSSKINQLPDRQLFSAFFESKDTKMTTQVTAAASSLVCGGSQQQPHRCPARIDSGVYRKSQTEISAYLRSSGFHNTYWPGCGSQRYNCATDFTRWVSAYSCTWGSFRTQANLFQNGTRWSYRTQSPEPNPEIFSYSWPVYWWGPYVQWWHISFCN